MLVRYDVFRMEDARLDCMRAPLHRQPLESHRFEEGKGELGPHVAL